MDKFETRTQIDEPIIKVYQYGSVVYGCTTTQSDADYIVVVEFDGDLYYSVDEGDANYTVYSEQLFIHKIKEHRIDVLECIFQIEHDPYLEYFKYDSEKLRRAISSVSSNSFVKCKKKLAIGEDYIGKKSMFHSLRILTFGIQIAKYGRVENYNVANELLPLIMELQDWDTIKFMCQPIYNDLKSEFKILAPLESEK
jgi:hypothetical protein